MFWLSRSIHQTPEYIFPSPPTGSVSITVTNNALTARITLSSPYDGNPGKPWGKLVSLLAGDIILGDLRDSVSPHCSTGHTPTPLLGDVWERKTS